MHLEAIRLSQNGKTIFLTKLKTSELLDPEKIKPDIYDEDTNSDGYQRPLTKGRATLFATYIGNTKNVSPPSVLIAVRDDLQFTPSAENPVMGYLDIPPSSVMYVVDGQHRIQGVRHLCSLATQPVDFELPVVVINHKLLGEPDPIFCEAKEFVVINQTQKKVRADLHDRFVAKLTDEQRKELDAAIPSETAELIMRAVVICVELNHRPGSPWEGVIKKVGQGKQPGYVKQRTFTDSIQKSFLADKTIAAMTIDDDVIEEAIDQWWSAWRDMCPEAFDPATRDDYILQARYVTIRVLHDMLRDAIVFFVARKTPFTKNEFKKLIEDMDEGNYSDYWKVGGPASKGAGEKGVSELYARLSPFFFQVLRK